MTKNVLILSAGDNHGAYEAAYKIAYFLYEKNYNVVLAVQHQTKSDPFIIQIPNVRSSSFLLRVFLKAYNKFSQLIKRKTAVVFDKKYLFLTEDENTEYISASSILENISFVPDLIIAGMIDGFCSTNTLLELKKKTNARIYTWLVDMAPLTGGCHYAWECKGYQHECKNCPAILSASKKDQAHINLMTKQRNVIDGDIRVLSGSQWVTEQAKKSTLFRSQKRIFNTHACIDTRIMNGNNRDIAKRIFNIQKDAKIIFTGSWNVNDLRKGMPYFLEALKVLWDSLDQNLRESVYILVAGEHYGDTEFLSEIQFKRKHIDYIKDYRLLSLAYQAADVFVCASIEDSGPMMVTEALACGTPVVGFRMGNVASLVENGVNGFVAELKDVNQLASGIKSVLSLDEVQFNMYSRSCIDLAERTSSHHAAVKSVELLFNEN